MRRVKAFLFFLVLLNMMPAFGFIKGFNQAWFKTSYSAQWLDGYYDKNYAESILILNKNAGSTLVRMWLYEGVQLNQFAINKRSGKLVLRPDFILNLKHFLGLARKHKVKVNLTFLDGNSFRGIEQSPELLNFWSDVFNDHNGALKSFYQSAIAPIYKLIQDEFSDVVTQVDLVNEVNAVVEYRLFKDHVLSMPKFLCTLASKSPSPVTASLGWANAEELFFSGFLANSCLNFYDLHFYNDSGTVGRCEDYKKLSKQGVRLQLGEFGQLTTTLSDDLQSEVTANFLKTAKDCGFMSALPWRLVEWRGGNDPEERFSYVNPTGPRKAYYVFKDFAR